MGYELDHGLILAAERDAAETNSHSILWLLKEYRFWANLAIENPKIKEAVISADRRAELLRKALTSRK